MKRIVMIALVVSVVAAAAAAPTTQQAIRAVLDQQVAGWNRGDLDAYMQGYVHSNELTFFSGATVTRGWEPTLERYKKRYQGEGKEMGTLTFSDVVIDVVAGDAAFVRGHWHLTMSKESREGLFTLLMRKTDQGWRVVHDHSS